MHQGCSFAVIFGSEEILAIVNSSFDMTKIMSSNRNRNGCSLLLSSVVVCMTNIDNLPSIGAYAYSSQLTTSLRNHKRCFRLSETKFHASAPVANELVAQEHTYSTSLFNVGYNAQSILNFYDQRPWEIVLRLNMLGLPLLGE